MQRKKLLFITQKIHSNDDDLAFVILWVKQFIKEGFDVSVICLEKGDFDESFPVYSLGKEKGVSKLGRIIRFFRLIFKLKYDRVFVHMNPEYITLGGWFWILAQKPIYLWYTHYTMHIHMRISGWLCKRMFAATAQSMPQYDGNPKKVIPGHGIDMNFWKNDKIDTVIRDKKKLVSVHRICRSKRLEMAIESLKYLPEDYTLDVYGRDVEKDYAQEMRDLVHELELDDRVTFNGPVPMWRLKEIYPTFRLMINMAPETIDKTVLEAMINGIYPVTTAGNSRAVGLPVYPEDESPAGIANFIKSVAWREYQTGDLSAIVQEKHSLSALVSKMSEYINDGK